MAVLALLLVPACAAAASGGPFAPLNRAGPPLNVPAAQLRTALQCTPDVARAARTPVLLNPATGVTAQENYSWNWERALSAAGIPWCAYTAPYHTLGDIPTSGEYLVYAIRTMYARSGRRIDILGHSQGGMSMRWALRFWPDTRHMVDDVVGFAGSNHGTTAAAVCVDGCPPAVWQQYASSSFIRALNSYAETFAGISYTEVYSHTDEVVQPNANDHGSSSLHTGGGSITNVATQDICPNDWYEHIMLGSIDPVAYALAIDALTHPGPADPARIPRSVCSEAYMPGIDPVSVQTWLGVLSAQPGLLSVPAGGLVNLVGAPEVAREPALPCYVFAACPGGQTRYFLTVSPRSTRRGVRTRFKLSAASSIWGVSRPLGSASLSFGRRHVRASRRGRVAVRITLRRPGRYRVLLRVNRRVVATRWVRVR